MEKFKLLLVDDEEEFVKSLSERLEMRDMRPKIAYDGEEALKCIKDEEPDVILLDLKMPGIHGIDVLRQVKKAYPKIQVVILTGHGTDKHESDARNLGAFDYLEKPVDIDLLTKTLKKAYRQKVEDAMVAATFAEAGDFDTAREILKKDKKK